MPQYKIYATDVLDDERYQGTVEAPTQKSALKEAKRRWRSTGYQQPLVKHRAKLVKQSNPPSGFIPCKAVKIERKNGGYRLLIKR